MVNPEQRDTRPHNSLERIHDLAASGMVHFTSTKVANDAQNLGYSNEEVCQCLLALNSDHFQESIKYPERRSWQDVYHLDWMLPGGMIDQLYIKMKLSGDVLWVDLHSFHRH